MPGQILRGQHPDVDMGKLNAMQRIEVHRMIAQMKSLQKEGIRLKREGFHQAQHVYDK